MNKLKWTVYWSCGPHDNPNDGEVDIWADTIEEVLEIFNHRRGDSWQPVAIDGIMRSDLI